MSKYQKGKFSRTLPQKSKHKPVEQQWLGTMSTVSLSQQPPPLQISPITNFQTAALQASFSPQKSMVSIREQTSSAAVQTSQILLNAQFDTAQSPPKKSLDVIHQVLSKLADNQIEINPYYGKNATGKLLELLRSRNKLKGFIGELEKNGVVNAPSQPIRLANQILALLLKKLEKNWEDLQVQVSDEQDDFELVIGEKTLFEKEEELEKLKKELQKKEQWLKEVQGCYLQTIGNLTDALDALSR